MIWKFLSKAICCFSLQNLPHIQLAISLSFVKLLWPLVRFISYSHDQDHVHVSTTCYASTLEVSKHPSIHKIQLHVYVWYHSLKNISRIWGYAKKKIKDAYPKKVCRMLRHVKKKRKEKIAPYPKTKKKRDGAYKGVHTPSTKNIHTLAHLDQGLWLVSPLDPVFDLAKYEKQVCLQILHTYSSTKTAIRDRLRKKGTIKKPW